MSRKKKENAEELETSADPGELVLKKHTGSVKVWSERAREYGLNDKQMKFAHLYANDKDWSGNGVQCYALAYRLDLSKPSAYNTAKTQASLLLKQDGVKEYIIDILEAGGLNDQTVDQHLLLAITQNADLGSKVAAIKHYNELKGRVKKAEGNSVNFQISIAPVENKTLDISHDEVKVLPGNSQ